MDAIGTAGVETSGDANFPDSGFFARSRIKLSTVWRVILNSLAMALLLMPSLCFFRIAVIDALASVCHASPSVVQRGLGETSGLGFLPQGHFSQGGFRSSSGPLPVLG